MGLGPHGTSLLARVGKPIGPITLEALILDREARGQARMIARIQHAKKHKAKVKPLAPVKYAYSIGKGHWWKWVGEKPITFEYDGVTTTLNDIHSTFTLKAAGFKLPKLPPKKERIHG